MSLTETQDTLAQNCTGQTLSASTISSCRTVRPFLQPRFISAEDMLGLPDSLRARILDGFKMPRFLLDRLCPWSNGFCGSGPVLDSDGLLGIYSKFWSWCFRFILDLEKITGLDSWSNKRTRRNGGSAALLNTSLLVLPFMDPKVSRTDGNGLR